MAKPWAEVAASDAFVNADANTKQAIQQQYFDSVIKPRVDPTEREAARAQFFSSSAESEATKEINATAWDAMRPYVAPAVDVLGAAGGGILGAAAGPLGAVAGAGLGYAGGKELMNIADTYLGGKPPEAQTPMAAATRVAGNLGEGAAYEMGGQIIAKPLGYVAGKAANYISDLGAEKKAAKILQEAAGADKAAVRGALAASHDVLPAQTLAGQNLPEVQALATLASARNPKPFDAILAQQKAQTVGELQALAQGGTQTEARAAQEAAKRATNAALIPERDLALRSANTAGDLLPGLEAKAAGLEGAAADATDMVRRFVPAGERALQMPAATIAPPPGMPRFPEAFGGYTYMGEMKGIADKWASRAAEASLNLGEGARFARSAADSLAAHGLRPLQSAPIVAGIKNAANGVAFAGNKPVSQSMYEVAHNLEEWTKNGGVIDAFALDAIRKNAVNAAIQRNLAGVDPKMQQKAAASILTEIRPLIDDAIEAAGGVGYKAYLGNYASAMQDIAKTKLAGKAFDLYKSSPDQFVKLVNGDAPKMVEKILGPGRYNISAELAPDVYATLKRAADGVTQADIMAAQSQRGRAALAEIIKQNTVGLRVPFFGVKETAANSLLGAVESRLSKGTMNKLSTAFQSAKGVDDLPKVVPAEDRTMLLRMINNPSSWLPSTLTGTMAGSQSE